MHAFSGKTWIRNRSVIYGPIDGACAACYSGGWGDKTAEVKFFTFFLTGHQASNGSHQTYTRSLPGIFTPTLGVGLTAKILSFLPLKCPSLIPWSQMLMALSCSATLLTYRYQLWQGFRVLLSRAQGICSFVLGVSACVIVVQLVHKHPGLYGGGTQDLPL